MAHDDRGVGYSSSSSPSYRRHNYDVFLSFRGDDTRESFTDHLYAALLDNEVITFRDEEGLARGQVIIPNLNRAIEESLSAIVVLSKNYAASRWCLDELLKILHSKKELGLHVFPIFYGVDPSDIRHQKGCIAEAFQKNEEKFAHDKIKVQRWRDALKEIADISGWNSQQYRYESKLIENVVEMVRSKSDDQPPFDSNDEGMVKTHSKLVGIDVKITDFDSILADTTREVQFIGIWGMGGLGKTTLARAIYERIKKNYEVYFFLQNVRVESAKDGGLIKLQEKLVSYPKKRIKMEVGDCYEGRKLIERRLSNKKVLLVLDDVSDMSQLENLAGKEGWFDKGSRIIITTRDQRLLFLHGVISQYEMDFLTDDESLQLFHQKAFKGDQPHKDYLELSKTVIKSARGLPLAIEVFGSFLCGRSKLEWEDALRKIHSYDHIFHILKVSFDGLEYNEKNIFLDIACFFNGMAMGNVKEILENSGLYPEIGIKVLIEKSLVAKNEGCLWVHDMLQEMGEKIVFLQSPDDVGKRSRIWSLEDANIVLRNYKRGTEAIRGIAVRFDKPYVIHLDPEAFSSLSSLRLLIISSHSDFSHGQLNLLHGLNCLSSTLKVIEWEGYPLDFLPSQTQFDELVDLKMQHSKLKELWRRTQAFLQCLKFIDLSHSTNLIRTPNFDQIPNLQRLILEGCTKLVEIHHSLGQHKNLVTVDFKGCKSIKTLPTILEMNCLETLTLSGCSKVRKLPEFGKGMEHFTRLDIEETAISKLPQSMVNLIGLAILNLKNCKNLICLPSDFQKLKAIKNINIFGCSKFSWLPENLIENEALEELDVGGTAIKEVPSSLNNLKALSLSPWNGHEESSSSCYHYSLLKRAFRLLRPSSSTKLPSFSNLSSLVHLNLRYCNLHDESLSSEISNLSSLTILDLCGNDFAEFPSGLISRLQKLETIGLNDCPRLQSLPKLPPNLSMIQAGDCPLLKHYVHSEQPWKFTEQFESQTKCRNEISCPHDCKCYILSDHVSAILTPESQVPDFFMQPTRLLTIPGSEVPSWFYNQSCFCVKDLPYRYTTNVSFIVNKPDSCRSSEWWGIAVCLVLENDLESVTDALCWTYSVSEGEYSNSVRKSTIYVQSSCRHQLCIIYIRFSAFIAEQIQMIFFTLDKDEQKKSAFKLDQCGWRVLCKEDFERRQNTRDEGCISRDNDEFTVEEDDTITYVEPSPETRVLRACLNFR